MRTLGTLLIIVLIKLDWCVVSPMNVPTTKKQGERTTGKIMSAIKTFFIMVEDTGWISRGSGECSAYTLDELRTWPFLNELYIRYTGLPTATYRDYRDYIQIQLLIGTTFNYLSCLAMSQNLFFFFICYYALSLV